MLRTPLLSTPVTSGSIPPVAVGTDVGTPASRPSSPQAERALVRTVSHDLYSRIEQGNRDIQHAETSSRIAISSLQAAQINARIKKLKLLHEDNQREAILATNKDICKETFVIEGMVAALEREKNPDFIVTHADIMTFIEEHSRTADGEGNSGYKRLFSDVPLFNGSMLEDKLGHITATFKAYEEVLNDLDENDLDRQYIQLSFDVFKGSVQDLVQEKSAMLAVMEAGTPEYNQAQKDLAKAKTVENLVLNKEIRQGLLAKQTTGNLMRALGFTVPAMGVASLVSFGFVKNMLDDFVTGQAGYNRKDWKDNLVKKTFVEGAGTGSVHAITSELVPVLVSTVAELCGGLPVEPVDVKRIYPDAPKVISENGIPVVLSDEEHAIAQQEVKNKRNAFMQAQRAYKIGAFAGDMVACASFTVPTVVRGLLNGVLINASNLGVRAASSSIGGGLMAGVHTTLQLRQTFDGVPTHTVGNPKGPKQILDAGSRLDPLKSGNRRIMGSKITGTAEDQAFMSGFDLAIANSSLSNAKDKPIKALIAFGQTWLGMHGFFSNAGAEAEVKAAQAQQVVPSSSNMPGVRTAVHGILNPNSAHIPHTFQDPNSLGRKVENIYGVARHTARVVPAAIIDSVDFVIALGLKGAVALPKTVVSTMQRLGRHSSYEPLLS